MILTSDLVPTFFSQLYNLGLPYSINIIVDRDNQKPEENPLKNDIRKKRKGELLNGFMRVSVY